MKSIKGLIVSIKNLVDLEKITKETKYINIDITNCDYEVIEYFKTNGQKFMFSETINEISGYIYVSYEEFLNAEKIIDSIYTDMPNNLSKLEIARYLYTKLAQYVYFDINIKPEKNDNFNYALSSGINNLWRILIDGRVNDIGIAKLYYYLCRRMNINITLEFNHQTKEAYNKLTIGNMILNADLFVDIPYIQNSMITKNFTPYNSDIELDKRVEYITKEYTDTLIDSALKHIDYTNESCIKEILDKTEDILNIENIKSVELSIVYDHIFKKYCPNYNIKINNLYFYNEYKHHFILISNSYEHYSYNYKKKAFVKVSDADLINSINDGKIGIYLDEMIPNLAINLNC